MAGKVTADEYKKVQDWLNQNYTQDSIKSYTNAYNEAKASGATTSQAVSSSEGLLKKNTSGGASGGSTASGGNSNNNAGDIYGDVSKSATTSAPMDFSKYSGPQSLSQDNAIFGKDAEAREKTNSGFISSRNDTIAYELKNKGITDSAKIEEYLNSTYNNFKNADATEKANTIRAISTRLSEIQKGNGEEEIKDTTKVEEGNGTWDKFTSTFKDYNGDGVEDKEGYYFKNGEYYRAYGYDSWSKELQNEFDRMSDPEKEKVSNMGADALQKYLKLGTDYKRDTDYLDKKHDIDTDLYKNSKRQAEIQMGQTLRHAEEGVNNLMQNWQYLGNMGMPGVSTTKLKAIGDAIAEAKTTLSEIEELEGLKMDAMENQWKEQELAYAKQIDDLTYNLTWQTSQEFVNWLGKFSAAELEGQLDTIDGITAFRKEMLDNLDKNLSGITSASLQQMQYITQQYQDIADKMYEYAQNQNKVNTEMSAVKGYYVDGNGNPIFNAKGETIQVPQSAPLDPIYDKETGKLIVFGYDENGQIVANIQNVLGYENPYYTGKGTGLGNMRTERHNNPTAMTVDVARSLGMREGVDYIKGESFVDSKGKTQYTAELLGDPIETTIRAFDNAAANGIGIFYTAKGGQRWTHTAMSNEDWMAMSDNQKRQTILKMLQREGGDINKMKFYNQGSSSSEGVNEYGFNPTKTGYYNKYLEGKFTTQDWKEIGNEDSFNQELEAYKNWVDSQVSSSTQDILRALYDLENITGAEYNTFFVPRTSGYSKKKSFEKYISDATLDKLINSKKNGATFGALSDAELSILQNAATRLDFGLPKDEFDKEVKRLIADLEDGLIQNGREDIISNAKGGITSDGGRETVETESGL